MSSLEEVRTYREKEVSRIKKIMNKARGIRESELKGGEEAVAFVKEDLCIGCDHCTVVCDDDAIELYDKPLNNPLLTVDINRKAKILRDECTGCRLCVLVCPTDAISMIDR